MYPDAADEKRTAFRREEKRYQLRRDQTFLTRRNRRVGGPLVTRRTCVADALDSRDLRFVAEAGGGEHGVRAVALADADRADRESHAGADPNRRAPREAYALACRPGFFIFPGALDVETQREWLAAAVTKLCEPPAETNHDAAHGPSKGCGTPRRATRTNGGSTRLPTSARRARLGGLARPPRTSRRATRRDARRPLCSGACVGPHSVPSTTGRAGRTERTRSRRVLTFRTTSERVARRWRAWLTLSPRRRRRRSAGRGRRRPRPRLRLRRGSASAPAW